MTQRTQTGARLLLALIRLVNGTIGLLAPRLILRRMGAQGAGHPAAQYALRLFGIRTILIAIDLLRPAGGVRDHAIRVAPLIHASDTLAATLAARSGVLPRRTATGIVAISGVNTLLALLMQPRRR
ncbi:MAG TPA: hypothetical protein VFZ66_23415 [Herpetosiphonaceae bacterium]